MKFTIIINLITLVAFFAAIYYILNSFFKNKAMSKKMLGVSVIGLLMSPILNIYNWNFTYTPAKLSEERQLILEEVQKQLSSENPDKVYNPQKIDKSEVSQEFTKQSAVDNLTSLLNEFGKDESGANLSAKERFDRIVKDENSFTEYVTDTALSKLYLFDTTNTKETQINTSLALLSFYSGLTNGDTNSTVKAALANLDYVYLDEKTKTAYIPLDFFTGTTNAMSFTMVFVDNEWKLSPYTLLQSIQLSDYIQQATVASQQTNQETQSEE